MNSEAGNYYTGIRSILPAGLFGNYHRGQKIAVAKKLFEAVLGSVDYGEINVISFTRNEIDILYQGELRELYIAYEASLRRGIELAEMTKQI